MGLIKLILIGGIIYYIGAGTWLWERVEQLDDGCYALMTDMGTRAGAPVCRGLSTGIAALNTTGEKIQDSVKRNVASIRTSITGNAMDAVVDAGDALKQAADNFAQGTTAIQKGAPNVGLQWLERGAQLPGYGVMSQLSLGDMYRQGTGGLGVDTTKATAYYQQALDSIRNLQASTAPEAQQILRQLPSSPEEVKAQLEATIQSLQR